MATAGEQQNATKAVFGALPMVAEPHGSPMQNHLSYEGRWSYLLLLFCAVRLLDSHYTHSFRLLIESH